MTKMWWYWWMLGTQPSGLPFRLLVPSPLSGRCFPFTSYIQSSRWLSPSWWWLPWSTVSSFSNSHGMCCHATLSWPLLLNGSPFGDPGPHPWWGPFWGFGSPFYVLGPLFFNFRLKNLGKMCHICIFFRNYSKWIGEGEGLMLQWPENIRIRWVLLVVKVIQYNVHFQYFRYIRNHIFSFTMHFLLYNATTVWLSRPDISGPARISGHLGKIARITPGFLWFCPDLCDSVHI